MIRPKESNYLATETHNADTRDFEDHTFCGIMFDVHCKADLPVKFMEIQSCWVRGELGPMQIFTTRGTYDGKHDDAKLWQLVFKGNKDPSHSDLAEIKLEHAIRIERGHSAAVYIHSGLPGDEALVYANQRGRTSHEDPYMKILPGMADLLSRPFSNQSPWGGGWGRGWRANREFVGRITYGIKYILWNPPTHRLFTPEFKRLVIIMLMVDNRLRILHDDTMFYILNMCRWDWNGAGTHINNARGESDGEYDDLTMPWRRRGGHRFRRRVTTESSEDSDELSPEQLRSLGSDGLRLMNIIRSLMRYNQTTATAAGENNDSESEDDGGDDGGDDEENESLE